MTYMIVSTPVSYEVLEIQWYNIHCDIFIDAEIEDFVGKKLTPALRQVVMNGGIHGTHQVWRLFVQMDVPKRLKKMEDALRYLPSIDSAFANTWEPPGNCAVVYYKI